MRRSGGGRVGKCPRSGHYAPTGMSVWCESEQVQDSLSRCGAGGGVLAGHQLTISFDV